MTFTGTKDIKILKNELNFINNCISSLKRIKDWTSEDKKLFYEMLNRKRKLEGDINRLTK